MRGCSWRSGWESAIRRWRRRYVTCGEPMPKFHNAKVFSLAKLDSVAEHELFITSDADVRVTKDYLRRMVQNLKDPADGAGLVRLSGDGGRVEARRVLLRSWMRWARAWR